MFKLLEAKAVVLLLTRWQVTGWEDTASPRAVRELSASPPGSSLGSRRLKATGPTDPELAFQQDTWLTCVHIGVQGALNDAVSVLGSECVPATAEILHVLRREWPRVILTRTLWVLKDREAEPLCQPSVHGGRPARARDVRAGG